MKWATTQGRVPAKVAYFHPLLLKETMVPCVSRARQGKDLRTKKQGSCGDPDLMSGQLCVRATMRDPRVHRVQVTSSTLFLPGGFAENSTIHTCGPFRLGVGSEDRVGLTVLATGQKAVEHVKRGNGLIYMPDYGAGAMENWMLGAAEPDAASHALRPSEDRRVHAHLP